MTVTGNSVINGDVEVDAGSGDAKEGMSLMLAGGTMDGDIVLTNGAETAIDTMPDKAEVKKATSFTQAAPEGYVWVDAGEGVQKIAKAVAEIDGTYYETLEAAVAAAVDGDTITVLKDSSGNGIQVPQGKFTNGLTVDFDGHTYTMDGAMVGSTGTQTQAFQLLKDNKITFKNGTLYSEKAKMLVQNYSDLTLDGMTLTLNNASYASAYANPAGGVAFDVCRYASYPSVSVTVTGNSVINGDIEVSASGSDAKDGFSLMLEGGTFSGAIVVDATAAAAMAAAPEKAKVQKKTEGVTIGIPEDYKWVETETAGTYKLVKKEYGEVITEYYLQLQSQISITLGVCDLLTDNVTSLAENGYYLTYQVEDGSLNTVYFSDLTKDSYNYYDIVIGKFAAKQMTEKVNVSIYDGNGIEVFTNSYSIQNYCKTVISGNYGEKLTNLCKTVLDYGTYSQKYFNYRLDDLANEGTDYFSLNTISSSYAGTNGNLSGVTVLKQLNLEYQVELWFEIDKDIAGSELSVAVTAENSGFSGWSYTISDPITDQYGEYVMVKIKGIPSGKLNEKFNLTLTNSNGTSTWSWSAMSFAYASQNQAQLANVSKALAAYYECASRYFN